MKVLNFGSLNYDYVYEVDHFVRPKETLSSKSYSRGFGGKGLNQSIALNKAGIDVFHAGRVGYDGDDFLDYLAEYNVNTTYLYEDDSTSTGHAIIEVCNGENRILLYGGANQLIDEKQIDETLVHFGVGDVLLIQNEISSMSYLIKKAHEIGMYIVFNTAPMDDKVFTYPLDLINMFIVNEIEGSGLAGIESDNIKDIIDGLLNKFNDKEIVLTVGANGSYFIHKDGTVFQEAYKVDAVDTTAAGDTFTGYFISGLIKKMPTRVNLILASKAAALAVTKPGAAQSIPFMSEVEIFSIE